MSHPGIKEIQFIVNAKAGVVTGLLQKPEDAKALLVLAHGAGAGMCHKFMDDSAAELAARGMATFRYQFPYMEKRIKRPDTEAVLMETVRAAVATAKKIADGLPLFAGGKSMGGRMTSLAAAQEPLAGVRGLVYFGFPLHAMGKPGAERGAHLADIDIADAVFAGLARRLGRFETAQAAVSKPRQAGRTLCRRRRRSFVSHAQERAQDG